LVVRSEDAPDQNYGERPDREEPRCSLYLVHLVPWPE
jgi:hypothetical protein